MGSCRGGARPAARGGARPAMGVGVAGNGRGRGRGRRRARARAWPAAGAGSCRGRARPATGVGAAGVAGDGRDRRWARGATGVGRSRWLGVGRGRRRGWARRCCRRRALSRARPAEGAGAGMSGYPCALLKASTVLRCWAVDGVGSAPVWGGARASASKKRSAGLETAVRGVVDGCSGVGQCIGFGIEEEERGAGNGGAGVVDRCSGMGRCTGISVEEEERGEWPFNSLATLVARFP
ncbi:uncharacterized protein [Miscanthus floridulus]|uniref:uncharacterized protein n=1 Tax=Miscanthus floridulus TaxID=154761 RepID=UPI00345772C0